MPSTGSGSISPIALGGAVASLATYKAAGSSEGVGTYVVFGGAVVIGGAAAMANGLKVARIRWNLRRGEQHGALPPTRSAGQRSAPERYGEAHQTEGLKYADTIRRHGGVCMEPVCVMPTRRIDSGAFWHLAHDHARGGAHDYLGPAHPECNQAEALRRGVTWDGAPDLADLEAGTATAATFSDPPQARARDDIDYDADTGYGHTVRKRPRLNGVDPSGAPIQRSDRSRSEASPVDLSKEMPSGAAIPWGDGSIANPQTGGSSPRYRSSVWDPWDDEQDLT